MGQHRGARLLWMVRALQGPVRMDSSAICPDSLTNKASSR